MADYSVQRIWGKELATRTADRIARIWAEVFNHGTIPDKKKFRDDLFFIARDKSGRLGGVGCLTPVEVQFRKERYAIMGLKSIVSQVRGKGFGRAVVEPMRDYLLKHDVTGIGFCKRYHTPFYEKCGFYVQRSMVLRFVRRERDGSNSTHPDTDDSDIISLEGSDALMTRILAHPRAKVYVARFW